MNDQTATCPVRMYADWSFHICGRPVKDEGLCGIHLAAKRRRQKSEEAYQSKRARQEEIRIDAKNRLDALGLNGDAYYSSASSQLVEDKVVVSLSELERRIKSDD